MIAPSSSTSSADGSTHVLFVCTGNAARSVMGSAIARRDAPHLGVASAGTHSIPGLPMSVRTRGALASIGASDPAHLSAQLDASTATAADMIVVFEPMHIVYVRREHPEVADRTASLRRFSRDLAPGPLATLPQRVAALGLAEIDFEPWEEVVDPAGGDLADFEASAREIDDQLAILLPKVDA